MNITAIEKLVRRLALDSSQVFVTRHARQRMVERGFSDRDLFKVLRSGSIDGEPARTPRGEVKCKMTYRLIGNRDAGAVTVIVDDKELLIVTMEWEDMR